MSTPTTLITQFNVKVDLLVDRLAAEFRATNARTGNLSSLRTSTNANLVAAVNELYSSVDELIVNSGNALLDGGNF